jgi:hypothetical protein
MQGAKYTGTSEVIQRAFSALNKIGGKNAGDAVLGSLEGSTSNYTVELVNDISESEQSGEFRPLEGGGGTLAISEKGMNVEGIAHEAFHAFQFEKGTGGRSILSEVEAFLFGAAMSGNRSFGNDIFGAGGSYQTFMTRLLDKWSAPTFWDAVDAFKTGSVVNRLGTYTKYSRNLEHQHEIIDAIYPLTGKKR